MKVIRKKVKPVSDVFAEKVTQAFVEKLLTLTSKFQHEGIVSIDFPFVGENGPEGTYIVWIGSVRKKYILGKAKTLIGALDDAENTFKVINEKGFLLRKPQTDA